MGLQQIPGHYIVSASATGGGGSNCVYSTAVTATATASGQALFTATQVPVSAYDVAQIIGEGYLGTADYQNAWIFPVELSAITAAGNISNLTITLPDYNYNPDKMAIRLTGATASGFSSFGAGEALLSNVTAPGQYTVPSATMVQSANNYKSWYNYTYLYIIAMAYYGNYTSVAPTADMSGASLTGTSLPFPDRPAYETASANLSALGYEYVGLFGPDGSWVSKSHASATATYSNGSGMSASSQDTGVVGCSKDVLYRSMNWTVKNSAAFDPVHYPSKGYNFTTETANYAYGASGLVG